MDCTICKNKGCRKGSPCTSGQPDYVEGYLTEESIRLVRAASSLVDGGRAGTLSRLEEIVDYAQTMGYRTLGVAYCYGMEKEAAFLGDWLKGQGFKVTMVSCTVDGLAEGDVNPDKTGGPVSCNPLGQARRLNEEKADLTILMGLCLGHDILIQKELDMPFTTWVVKDRVTGHRPLDALPGYHSREDRFLTEMDRGFNLVRKEEFLEILSSPDWRNTYELLDLRGREVFEAQGIPGSRQCLLSDLPASCGELFPDRHKEILVYCNGGIQSVYAVMYLKLKGYPRVRSLAGGISTLAAESLPWLPRGSLDAGDGVFPNR